MYITCCGKLLIKLTSSLFIMCHVKAVIVAPSALTVEGNHLCEKQCILQCYIVHLSSVTVNGVVTLGLTRARQKGEKTKKIFRTMSF